MSWARAPETRGESSPSSLRSNGCGGARRPSRSLRSLPAIGCLVLIAGCGPSAPKPVEPVVHSKRAETTSVFFVVDYEALLPVACHDAKKHVWASGAKCLEMMPDEATVRLESGRSAKIIGKRVPTIDSCTLSTTLLEFEDAKAEKPGTFAMWPDSEIDAPHRIKWDATKKGSDGLSEHEKVIFGSAASKALDTSNIKVIQVASADLDADGASEVVVSATSGGFDPTAKTGTAGLFALDRKADTFMTVRTSPNGPYRLEGTIDVNGDGMRELLLSERRFQPSGARTDTFMVLRFVDGKFENVAEVESCWPKPKT